MTEYRTTIQTSQRSDDWLDRPEWQWLREAKRQRDREISGLLVALVGGLILLALVAYMAVSAIAAHRAASQELNTTIRQLHLKNELAISKLENREPRLQPSESPIPE